MSVAILNDLHFGYGGAKGLYEKEARKFLDEVFFPWLDATPECRTVVIAGDLMDNRRETNVRIADDLVRRSFFDRLTDRVVHIIPGNHDVYYRNRLRPNSVECYSREYPNVHVHMDPVEVEIDGATFLMLPWECSENETPLRTAVSESKARFCVAHLDLVGFEMQSGVLSEHGGDRRSYSHFDKVFTGHYHARSERGNILYMGTHYHMNRADSGITKAFHVLDAETGETTRVDNPRRLYFDVRVEDELIGDVDFDAWLDGVRESFGDGGVGTFHFSAGCSSEFVDRACDELSRTGLDDFKIVFSRENDVEHSESEVGVRDTMELVVEHARLLRNDGVSPDRVVSILRDAHETVVGGAVL